MQWIRLLWSNALTVSVLAITVALSSAAWAGSTYKVLYSFKGGRDGGGVFAGVAFDTKGNLYGTTWSGGAYGEGTVFELSPSAGGKWSESILHSFCRNHSRCADGALPQSTPVFDAAGNLYGTSNVTAFELSPDSGSWSFSVISNDAGGSSLTIDSAGNLYGAGGSVWELVRDSGWKVKELHIFCSWHECDDGEGAPAPPVFDAAGNLYGTTKEGGVHKAGVAFELERTAAGWREHVLHSFPASVTDGYTIYGGLVLDGSGNLYGTTLEGGRIGAGTVFQLSKRQDGSWKETILYDFPNASVDGGAPAVGLVFDKAGNLYGTATGGGDPSCSCGVVFKMTPQAGGKWQYTVLHRFTGKDGYSPQAGVILDDKGTIYGTTTEGGPGGYGVVFEVTP